MTHRPAAEMPEFIYVTPSSRHGDDFPATKLCLPGDTEYIRADLASRPLPALDNAGEVVERERLLVAALVQAIDDMGEKTPSVCTAVKDMMINAVLNRGWDHPVSAEDLQRVLDCDDSEKEFCYLNVTPPPATPDGVKLQTMEDCYQAVKTVLYDAVKSDTQRHNAIKYLEELFFHAKIAASGHLRTPAPLEEVQRAEALKALADIKCAFDPDEWSHGDYADTMEGFRIIEAALTNAKKGG